jgi:hypothetical protein
MTTEHFKNYQESLKRMYEKGKKDKADEIKQFIEKERDNGNMYEGQITKGFSASLCLSKLLKQLGEK